jgi:hypothetical protein
VRHSRLVIHRLLVDGVELVVRFGTLVVVERDGGELDWEVVAETTEEVVLDLGVHAVELLVVSGTSEDARVQFADLMGDAVVVRFAGPTVVLRGDGELEGFDADLLSR